MTNISNRTALEIIILVCIIVSAFYLIHTPFSERCYDCQIHTTYAEIMVKKHHYPHPYEGGPVYHHPPLYYLIASFISPQSIMTDSKNHINYVLALSIVYGAIALLTIAFFLKQFNQSPFLRMLIVLFIATTPKFIIIFTSYNPDSLAVLLAISLLVISYELSKKWSSKLARLLLIVSVAGLYTKFNVGIAIISVIVTYLYASYYKKKKDNVVVLANGKIITILIFSFVLLFPWLYFHNYLLVGKLMPLDMEYAFPRQFGLSEIIHGLEKVIRIPFLQLPSEVWSDPWVHTASSPLTKTTDYWVYMWINSVIGACIFYTPGIKVVWVMLIAHLVAYLIAIKEIFKSNITKMVGLMLLVTHVLHIAFVIYSPIGQNMEHRYVAWTWIYWAVLYASVLSDVKSLKAKILKVALITGIVINIYVDLVVTGVMA